jgi:gamma-glutamyltranspeptidase/glutathione hydrolase
MAPGQSLKGLARVQSKSAVRALRAIGLVAALSGAGCQTLGSLGNTFFGGSPAAEAGHLTGFIGAAIADEPRAALAGREVLALGGSAADAAVAMGFMLAVTLPSRAGLGGGGVCVAYDPSEHGPGNGNAEAILFLPTPPATSVPGTDRQAAIPMMARGLFALHARYGKRPFESLITPAEQAARFGVPVSRALVRDLTVVAGPLVADPNARAVFAPNGSYLNEGGSFVQPDLGATLAQIRTAGVADLYQGALARQLEQASRLAGGGLTVADMRAALPRTSPTLTVGAGRDYVGWAPGDGGTAAAAAFQALQSGAGNAQAVAVRAGQGGLALPASTGFAVLDREGKSVACTVTMNNLFGTGRIAPGTGILLAKAVPPSEAPLLTAAIAWNSNLHGFRAAVTGTGQEAAALAGATALSNAIRAGTAMPAAVPEPGRANVITCSRYLPDSDGSCTWAADPRGAGLAAAGN